MYAASPAAEPYGPQSFAGNTGWLNSPPIDAHSLRGSIVFVDFWEYTCVNCLRTLPYLREWYKRYAKYGFTIVGVHTPEFDFSAQPANVQAAVRRLDIDWPVVMDANLAIWNQYRNDGWPHEYLYDRSGRLVESVFGEGRYQDTERAIQRLLEAGGVHGLPPVVPLLPQDSYTKPGAVCYPQTAELIVKHVPVATRARSSSPAAKTNIWTARTTIDGRLYLQGYWKRSSDAVVTTAPGDSAALAYHAIQVVAVMKPENGSSIHVNVTQNGRQLSHADAGADIRFDSAGHSFVVVNAARAYDLVANAAFGQYELRLSPQQYGLGLYSFAFESCEVPHP